MPHVGQANVASPKALMQNKGINSKAHSLDSFRTEPEQLTDPVSTEGQSAMRRSLLKLQKVAPNEFNVGVDDCDESLASSQYSSMNETDVV